MDQERFQEEIQKAREVPLSDEYNKKSYKKVMYNVINMTHNEAIPCADYLFSTSAPFGLPKKWSVV
jgi:hypothetical protein